VNYLGVATDAIQAASAAVSGAITSGSVATGAVTATSVTSTSAVIGGQPILPNITSANSNATAGNGTLTAAQISGAEQVNLLRTGPTGAYADTTDTAAAIIAAIATSAGAAIPVGFTYLLRIVNTVAFIETLTGGTGVTITGTNTLAASSTRDFSVRVTGAATITMTSIGSGAL
jgi:hypothetical protein